MAPIMVVTGDGQTPQPGYMPRTEPAAPESPGRENPPTRVIMAMKFVEMCNAQMGFRQFVTNDYGGGLIAGEPRMLDLHCKQEAAFRLACECLGQYFTGVIK